MQTLMGILVREAGKTFSNAIAEVREAVDFLRYYAGQVRDDFANDTHRPLGPVVCISPWNFPLAIFTGQVAAALAAGNSVLAKPAEQTPLIAAQAVRILLEAGVPPGVLQLLPGRGETVGATLVTDARVRGVMFTGSTEVAGILQRSIAARLDPQGRPTPLIAETGGLNAMIVDSSALTEQVVVDVLASAFDSAGQRCSALRVLCLQEDVADHTLKMLRGAMAECRMGNPDRLSTDIGPVIDAEAKAGIERHIQAMRAKGRKVYQAAKGSAQDEKEWARGTFVPPTLIELDSFDELQERDLRPGAARGALPPQQPGRAGRADQRLRLWPDARRAHPYRRDHRPGDRPRQSRQPVRQPQHGWRGGGRAAVRRRRPVGHRSESRRPAVPVPSAGEPSGGRAAASRWHRQDAERPVDAQLNTALPQPLGALQSLEKWAVTSQHGELAALAQRYAELAQAGTAASAAGPDRRAQYLYADAARARAVRGG